MSIGARIGSRVGARAGSRVSAPPAAAIDTWTMTKSGGVGGVFDAGASSVQTCAGACRLEFTVPTSGSERAIGLSQNDPDQNYNTVQWGLDFPGTTVYVIETVGPVLAALGPFTAGDDFAIVKLPSGIIEYYQNGAKIYESATVSATALRIDSAMADAASQFTAIKLFDNGNQVPITWQNVVNVTLANP